ncbi:transcriptional regulator [Deinococcus cavernae]|uniref:Transcriptional regulator n=1 Tax=Deinococcus cavernae TaxID=2320857 RepID=A0A418V082_9DEIO|nr:transcriptional regulator [Deinococcus cavernae]RJF69132.1 transcriptional regulator [Deinococcus cavernae]
MTLNWRELSSARRTHWPAARGALARPRVVDALNTTLLVVTAPAGYGKTTALAATLPGTGWPAAWLTLDADDADPQVLAAGLALAVAHLPGGHAPGRWLDQGASPVRVASRTADVLHAAQAWLVIDEAHYLTSPLLAPMLRELLDCGEGHVALLSRVPLKLPELVPLEAAGIVATLTAADLSFTPEELAELFGAHGQHPTPAEVRMAHALTEGWPIAARYLVQATAQGRVNLRTLRDLDGGDVQLGALFTYLAQEVLGPLEPALRALLTRSSVFEELTPELLEQVLDEREAPLWLEALAGSGTFLTKVGADSYRAHPLLRAHLRTLLAPAEAQAISARGAAYFAQTGRFRRALAAYLTAGAYPQAAAVLETHGAAWLALGRVTLVERSLARLPAGHWTPALHGLSGDTLRLASRYGDALAAYRQADPLTRAVGEIQVALDTVQPSLAWEALERAEGLAPPASRPLIRRLRAENLLNAGRLSEATALEPALQGGIRYALRSGDVHRALHLAEQAAAGETGGPRAAQNHRESVLLASFLNAVVGRADEAAHFAREGVAEGERLDSPFVQALALARLGHARLVAQDEAGAEAAYREALARAQGVTGRLQVEALLGLMTVRSRRGAWAEGQEHYTQALERTAGDAYMTGLLHLRMALNAVQDGREAGEALALAEAALTQCGDALGLAAVALARLAADPTCPVSAQTAADLLRYPFLLTRVSLLSPLLSRAGRAHLLARFAAGHPQHRAAWTGLAEPLGYPDLTALAHAPGFEIHVQVLGRVAVHGEDGEARDWGRARARDLLHLLALHPEGVGRLQAQEALFPDAEPGIGERNFRVTLHALAQVLEQGAPSGTFLERGDWLRLRRTPDLRVDLWEAGAALQATPGSPERLPRLLTLPPDIAESDLPQAQAAARQYALALPQALAEEAELARTQGDLAASRAAAERALSLDPAHEPAARTLMRLHQKSGNAAAIQRVYGQLLDALHPLGLTPLPETALLYQTLKT